MCLSNIKFLCKSGLPSLIRTSVLNRNIYSLVQTTNHSKTEFSRISFGFDENLSKHFCTSSIIFSAKKLNYLNYVNEVAKKRKPSLIRELTKKLATAEPGTIFMAGGLPNPELFPFEKMNVTLDSNTTLSLDQTELRAALQYQPTLGYPLLHEELKKLMVHFFNPPNWENSEVIVTVGSQNALSSVLEMTLSHGDPVVVPKPVYSSALSIMDPYSPIYLSVPEDSLGMQPEHLETILANWHADPNNKKVPKILYVNPTAANPSGVVIPTERKRQIYKLAQQYDLLILEDDPYYFLHFQKEDPTSFISMDVDGRVLRFDSFSKILSSGLRMGFATGPKELIRYLELSLQASVLHASSLSQVLVHGVLKEWGIPGFIKHTDEVKKFYRRRRDLMVAAADKHLKGLAEWVVPDGGMFLWMKILGVKDTFSMVMEHGLSQKIMLLPGREFMTDRSAPCQFLRASYSVVPEPQIDEGMERLAALIRDEQRRSMRT